MPKFSAVNLDAKGAKQGFMFQCPGCGCAHYVQTNRAFSPCWHFNGDVDRPTVSPSIKVVAPVFGQPDRVCHSYIKDGMIQFLGDCTHELAGQTVELPEF